jgi:hypothetical protein
MSAKSKGPGWGMLYLVLPLTCGLLWLEHQAPMPAPLHQVTMLIIVFVVFGLIALWSQSNGDALEAQQRRDRCAAPASNQAARHDTVAAEPGTDIQPAAASFQRKPRDYGLNPVMMVITHNDISSSTSFSERSGQNGR